MFYSQSSLSRHGPLGTIWLAAYYFKKLKKSQVKDTDISSSVDKILQDEFDVVTYRILAYLLLGIVRIYSKKVEYLYDDCNKVLLKIKDYMVKFKDSTVMETLQAPYFSITLPETFELDAFDLEILEDATGYNVVPYEEITLKESIWKSGKTGQSSLDKRKDYAACHDNIPGEDLLLSHHMDFEMMVEEEPANPISLSTEYHQAEREHTNITETLLSGKVYVKASRQELINSSLYQEANVNFKTAGGTLKHNQLGEHDMDVEDTEVHEDAGEHFDLSEVDAIIEKLRCGSFSQEKCMETKVSCTADEISTNVGPICEEQQFNAEHNKISEIKLSENVKSAEFTEDQLPSEIRDASPLFNFRDNEVFCTAEGTSASVGPLAEEQQSNAENNRMLEKNLSELVKGAMVTKDKLPSEILDASPLSKFRDNEVFCTVEETSANVGLYGEEQQSNAEPHHISGMKQSDTVKSAVVTEDQPQSKILDGTPQSKFRGEDKLQISVIHTPAANERSQVKRKRNCCWDDVIVFPNDFIKKFINDSSILVSKRRKAPGNALASWRSQQVSGLPHCFQEPLISGASLELSSLFSWKKLKIPKSVKTVEVPREVLSVCTANGRSDEIVETSDKMAISQLGGDAVGDTEPVEKLDVSELQPIDRSMEHGEPSVELDVPASLGAAEPLDQISIAPDTPVRQASVLRSCNSPERPEIFNSHEIILKRENGNKGPPSPCKDQKFDFSFLNKEMNSCEGMKYDDQYGLSERARLVGKCLHTGFKNQRNQGEDEVVNLLQVLDGKNQKESARIFYEILVLKSKGFVLVKQENAYADILVTKGLRWDEVFGTDSS